MTGGRTFVADDWTASRAVDAKAGRTVSVCIPCRDEAATIGPLIDAVHGPGDGTGNALWASLVISTGDDVVWRDGVVTSFRPRWVPHLLAPLLDDDSVALGKARHERVGGGGRTTELVARPLLSMYAPALTALAQPLAGEMAPGRSPRSTSACAGTATVELADLAVRPRGHRHRPQRAWMVRSS